jgi:DNA-binding NarL/FixJ family response regulator
MSSPDSEIITLSLVEDDAEAREAWVHLLNGLPGYRCLSAFGSGEAALVGLPKNPPNFVLMDINLGEMSGIDCTKKLGQLLPEVEVVMLTTFSDRERIFEALCAGACGYLLKRTTPELVKKALDELRGGGAPMSPQIARQVVGFFQRTSGGSNAVNESPAEMQKLTDREYEILRLLADGLQFKAITSELGISIGTVKTHILRIYKKLHVNSRSEAIVKFLGFQASVSKTG